MKILTKEEEDAHYSATVKGGIIGGLGGLGVGVLGVLGASRRFPLIQHLTVPMKAFLVTSSGTFSAIISADKASRAFEQSRHPEEQYKDASQRERQELEAGKSTKDRVTDWARENRYGIVGGSWVASMAIALGIVGRSPYLTTPQKLVQARVYAQGLTLAVLVATAAFELSDQKKGEGRWETVKVLDPNDPTHKHMIEKKIHHESYAGEDQWRDMVETEERKLKEREHAVEEREAQKHNKSKHKKDSSHEHKGEKKEDHDSSKKEGNKEEFRSGGSPRPPNLP